MRHIIRQDQSDACNRSFTRRLEEREEGMKYRKLKAVGSGAVFFLFVVIGQPMAQRDWNRIGDDR
jgi:hypothetical protein